MPRLEKQAPRTDFVDSLLGLPTSPRFAPRQTLGTSGTAVFGGYPDSRELDASLNGTERYKTYSQFLVNITILGASARLFLNLASMVDWKFQPADDTPEAEKTAELVTEMFDDMATPWRRVRKRNAGYKFHGFSIAELTFKLREDGNLGIRSIDARPQTTIERWQVDKFGEVHGVTQRSPQTFEELFLPRGKIWYQVDDELADGPEGLGLFRHIVEAARRSLRYEQLEGWGFETDLRGVPIVRFPESYLKSTTQLSDAAIKAMKAPLEGFAKKHNRSADLGMVLDSLPYFNQQTGQYTNLPLFDVQLLRAGSTSLPDLNRALERIAREVARVFGTEFLLLGSDGKGSLALSEDKTSILAMIVDSTNSEMCESVRSDILKPLFLVNGWPMELVPKPVTDKVQWRDIEQVTRALRDMAAAGAVMMPDDPAVEEVRSLLGLTAPDMKTLAQDAAVLRSQRNALPGDDPENDDTTGKETEPDGGEGSADPNDGDE